MIIDTVPSATRNHDAPLVLRTKPNAIPSRPTSGRICPVPKRVAAITTRDVQTAASVGSTVAACAAVPTSATIMAVPLAWTVSLQGPGSRLNNTDTESSVARTAAT